MTTNVNIIPHTILQPVVTPTIANATSVTLLPANPLRTSVNIQNNSAANIAFALGGGTLTGIAPTLTNKCFVLSAGAAYENGPLVNVTGAITVYQTSGGSFNLISAQEGLASGPIY